MKALVFAAGLGTRLKPLTDTMPKALVPVAGEPLLSRVMRKLVAAGYDDIVINVHHFADMIRDYVAAQDNFGVKVSFSDETDLLRETGGGIRHAAPLLAGGEPFLVHNVDILSNLDLAWFRAQHQPGDLATILVSDRPTQRYFLFDKTRRLMGWTNLKTGEVKPDGLVTEGLERLAFSGMHVVSPEIFKLMRDYPDRFPIVDFYLDQCKEHVINAYVPSDYRMMDIGKIDSLQEAEHFAKSL